MTDGTTSVATHHSVCPLDCPDRCSLEVRVQDGRVVALDGSRVNPVTAGFICEKVRRYPERVYAKDRLLHPARRVGAKGEGRFEPISWDEALDLVAKRLQQIRDVHGGEAILPFAYGGSNGLIAQGTADERFFRAIGASRLDRTVCAAQTGAVNQALYGKMASVDLPDFARARLIVIWGANPKHGNVHLMPYLKKAREAGGRVVAIDPRCTMSAAYIDEHLPVYPGTDIALALGLIHHLERMGAVDRSFLEAHATGWERVLARAREWPPDHAAAVCGVEARKITALAEAYAASDPALIRCGWGLERNRNGEAAVAAVLALPAIAGKFGRPGGGYALSASEAYGVNADRLAGIAEPRTRHINMSQLGRVLLEADPPVRALFVYDCNPAVTLPDQNRVRQGLRREDLFTIVFDQVMTDTARFADVLLPATTFLEQTDLAVSYGTYGVMLSEPVIPPVGESRPNDEVFRALLPRLGIHDAGPDGDERLRAALAAIEGPLAGSGEGDRRLERLRKERVLHFNFPGESPVQFATVFPKTEDGKVHLWPAELGDDPYRFLEPPLDPDHPLALISPATDRTICSTLAETSPDLGYVELHPEDAAARGLREGEDVRVHNRLGEVVVPLRLNPDLRPGVVNLPKGMWNRHTRNGSVGTALVSDEVSPVSGGARFNDARVDVGPAEPSARD